MKATDTDAAAGRRPLVAGRPLVEQRTWDGDHGAPAENPPGDDGSRLFARSGHPIDTVVEVLGDIGGTTRIEHWHLWLAVELVEHATGADPACAAGAVAIVAALLARMDDGDVHVRLAHPGGATDSAGRRAPRSSGGALVDLIEVLAAHPGGAQVVSWVEAASDTLVRVGTSDAPGDFAAICGRTPTTRPLVVDGTDLYVHRLHRAEVRLARSLARRAGVASVAPDDAVEAAIRDVLARPAVVGSTRIELADEQVRAVRAACSHAVSVVSGGPGTGKTSVIVAILRALSRLGVDPDRIALAAPTGKAAWRMGEALEQGLSHVPDADRTPADERLSRARLEPRTLHRLLRWSPGSSRFEHGETLPLPADVVIVDESSMVPLWLMDRLVAAVAPTARLVLLGDADQLPSVEAGSVFADLAPPRGAPPTPVASSSIRLVRSFRMREDDPAGRAVLTVARRIRDGDTDLATSAAIGQPALALRSRPGEIVGSGVESIDARGADLEAVVVDRLVDRLFGTHERRGRWLDPVRRGPNGFDPATTDRLHATFDALEAYRVLCVTRQGPRGTDAVGARIDARVRAVDERAAIGLGAPILVTRNDPGRGLFNGDLGLVLDVRAEGVDTPSPRVVFRRGEGFAAFAPAAIASISRRSWALTVHKAQGSEVDELVLVLPRDDGPLLHRSILYTALTRARRSVVLVGSMDRIRDAVRRAAPRATCLAERLEAAWREGAEFD